MSLNESIPLTVTRRAPRRIRQTRGESREILLHHEAPHTDAKLIRVGTGGVDRQTGEPLVTYFEVVAKLRRQAEVTRTFRSEWNARIAYLMAQHGELDFTAQLGAIGERVWPEPKNLTALGKMERRDPPVSPVWTRMDTGDSEADSELGLGVAPWIRPERPGLFREVPVEELEAEEQAVLRAAQEPHRDPA